MYDSTVGRNIGSVYLPPELSAPGTAVEVEVLGQAFAASVVADVLHDPEGTRIRA